MPGSTDLESAVLVAFAVPLLAQGDRTVENQTDNFQERPRFRETHGEILANGVVIELLTSSSGDRVTLFHWDGKNSEIGPQFQHGSTIYRAPYLQPGVLQATRFPCGVAEYGTPPELFWKVVNLFCHYLGFSRELAAFMTGVVFSSWFPDCCARPITLCISGTGMDRIMQLFRFLHIFCRRPLMVAELSPSLPFFLRPTLLVSAPPMSARAGSFWRASNYRGAFVSGPRGTVRSIACSKIIFCETEAALEAWGPEAFHIALLPTSQELPFLTEPEEARLAADFQPQFLMLRLRNLSVMDQSVASSGQTKFAGLELGGNLPACIADDPEIVKILTPLLEAHEQELVARRSLDPLVAIVEATWAPAHEGKEISTAQIAQRVNDLLRNRGESLEYSAKEIGWKLKKLGLHRHDNGSNRVLQFFREMRRRSHQLAAQFGLKRPKVVNCADCEDAQLIVQE